MKSFRFYKDNHKWYIDLPDWEGSIDDLEMVMGADTLLDMLAQGSEAFWVTWDEKPFLTQIYTLDFVKEEFEGAFYTVKGNNITEFSCWLCAVTKFVFGYYPKVLYVR